MREGNAGAEASGRYVYEETETGAEVGNRNNGEYAFHVAVLGHDNGVAVYNARAECRNIGLCRDIFGQHRAGQAPADLGADYLG